jgi:asparagine synthase (glutamine-hydrolysing)
MSGIAGMLRFDGAVVTERELQRAAGALHRHGPDRGGAVAEGAIGFAHVLMRMTPEDRFDRQPLRGEGGALVTADLRLDNRDELLDRVGVAPRQAAQWCDARVLLAAWERFGDDVWPVLRGPFAAAIWDPRTQALTLARDPLGLNVVMWHRSERFFAFASMPSGLFAFAGVPRELNEEKFADFLVLNHADHASTIYREIFRVPPAHFVRIARDGALHRRRYWSPSDVEPIRLRADADYAEALRANLDRAVRRQLRSAHAVGCLLSGGLDSSSVAALAARALAERGERLAAFTGVPRRGFADPVSNGAYADETPLVEAIRRAVPSIDVTYVHNDECDDFAELEGFFAALEGPVRNPINLGWTLAALRRARAQGRRVLLGGLSGNVTVSWTGWSQSADHLRHGRLLTALRQWRLFYRRTPYGRPEALRKLFVEPLTPLAASDWIARRLGRDAPWRAHAPIRPDFAAAMGVDARARQLGHDFRYRLRPDERIRALTQADYAGDWRAAEKAASGVEVRDPTADLDVVAFCLGIPPEQYLAEGVDRSLIRRAMWGLLPASVLANRLSGLQAADWYEKLERRRAELCRQLAELSHSRLARRMIDLARLERALAAWPAGDWYAEGVFAEYGLALTRGLAGGMFLRWFEQANRGAADAGIDGAIRQAP